MGISVFPAPAAGAKEKRIDLITATGSWVAPTGVTYAIAHIMPGGGGGGNNNNGATGGTSSAFGRNALGAVGGASTGSSFQMTTGNAAGANTGGGGMTSLWVGSQQASVAALNAQLQIFGSTVIPGTSYTITVGAGGSGLGNGGSGFVAIEYYI